MLSRGCCALLLEASLSWFRVRKCQFRVLEFRFAMFLCLKKLIKNSCLFIILPFKIIRACTYGFSHYIAEKVDGKVV